MKVRDQIAALSQFDGEEEVLPCFPAGMPIFDCSGITYSQDSGPRHFNGAWPDEPADGDTVRETGKRFGKSRTWRRVNGQWLEEKA